MLYGIYNQSEVEKLENAVTELKKENKQYKNLLLTQKIK
jgi:hypothetical protein